MISFLIYLSYTLGNKLQKKMEILLTYMPAYNLVSVSMFINGNTFRKIYIHISYIDTYSIYYHPSKVYNIIHLSWACLFHNVYNNKTLIVYIVILPSCSHF